MDDFFSDEELEITELPEREEMLNILGILTVNGLGNIFPITVGIGD